MKRLTPLLLMALSTALAGSRAAAQAPVPSAPAATNLAALSVADCVLMALERNPGLRVQRLAPAITRTREEAARAAFDPALAVSAARPRQTGPSYALLSGSTSEVRVVTERTAAEATLGATLPSGTRIEAGAGTTVADSPHDQAATRVGVTLTQPLLDGFGTGPQLAELRQARLDTRISVYELQAVAMALVADVEHACWAQVLARTRRDAVADALRVAEQQLAETRERIRVGKLPSLDAVAAEAEVALRRASLVQAETDCEAARLRLIRLLNPAAANPWLATPAIADGLVPPAEPLEALEASVARALDTRPDLCQARLALARNDLDLVRTRNGLLPRLDVFITLGRSGYASSFADSTADDADHGSDRSIGLVLNMPLANRAAQADHQRARLTREQSEEALASLSQLAQEDVRLAWTRADRSRDQLAAADASLALQERKLAAESAKFREGASTPFLVAQAERDVLESRLARASAVVAAILFRTDLHLQEGTLLARRGLAVPGD